MFRSAVLVASAVTLSFGSACSAIAGVIELTGFTQLTFEGTVEYQIDDTFELVNPDGSRTTFSRDDLPDFGIAEGSTVKTTFTFRNDDEAFSNSACGGRYRLNTGLDSGACSVATTVSTPFGNTQYGGSGGDTPPSITGLFVDRDPVSGEFSVALPDGDYEFSYAAVPDYQYDSFTQMINAPGFPCVSAFNCADDFVLANSAFQAFPLRATGDLGRVDPGFNVGYDAGIIGYLRILGGFSFQTDGGTTQVPAPGMLLLFGMAAAMVPLRKRLSLKSRRA